MKDKRHTMTSIESNDALEEDGHKARLHWKVHQTIGAAGTEGITQHEAAHQMGGEVATIGPRFNELRKMGLAKVKRDQDGKIVKIPNVHSPRRRPVQVWVLTDRTWEERLPIEKDRENKDHRIRKLLDTIEDLNHQVAQANEKVREAQAALEDFKTSISAVQTDLPLTETLSSGGGDDEQDLPGIE